MLVVFSTGLYEDLNIECVYMMCIFFSQFTHTAAASSVTAGTERQIIKDCMNTPPSRSRCPTLLSI